MKKQYAGMNADADSRAEHFVGLKGEFIAAATWVNSLVANIGDDAWLRPGLGNWDTRALVGHTSRAMLTVEEYLQVPPQSEDVASAADYFVRIAAIPGANSAEVEARGVAAGERLGALPVASFAEVTSRVTALISEAQDALLTCPAGGIRLSHYLPTRTFELTVHGVDIARATGQAATPPADALARTLELASTLALLRGDGVALIEALTGRGSLPRGFSVLGG